MIDFRRHMEISRAVQSGDGLLKYIGELEPAERIKVGRAIDSTYPLKESLKGHYDALDKFTCYRRVEDLVLGQFIMLEQIITGKSRFSTEAENDFALAKLLLRPKHHKDFDNENEEDEKQNEEAILNTDVKEVFSVLKDFLDNREYVLFSQFKGVFYEINEDGDDEEEELEKTGEALFNQQWYWYSMVRMLAKEDITKYGEIYMLKMSVVMPEMSYLAQRKKIESAKARASQAMSRL